MAKEEDSHRAALIALHQERFGETIPLIRREHVAGFYGRRPTWLADTLSLDQMRSEAAEMEKRAERFYLSAAAQTKDAHTRKILGDLAAAEARHHRHATDLEEQCAKRAKKRKKPQTVNSS